VEIAEEQDRLEDREEVDEADDGLPVDGLADRNDRLEDGLSIDEEVALPADNELAAELPDSEKQAGGQLPQDADETESVGPDGDKRCVEGLDDCSKNHPTGSLCDKSPVDDNWLFHAV